MNKSAQYKEGARNAIKKEALWILSQKLH